jgi:hypothetical protein
MNAKLPVVVMMTMMLRTMGFDKSRVKTVPGGRIADGEEPFPAADRSMSCSGKRLVIHAFIVPFPGTFPKSRAKSPSIKSPLCVHEDEASRADPFWHLLPPSQKPNLAIALIS